MELPNRKECIDHKQEKKRAIIVLGMHRSGTSAITRLINLAGATLPSNLLEEKKGNNDKGFWESKDLMHIHNDLLKSANSCWDDVSSLPPSWYDSDIAITYRNKVLDVLEKEFSDSPLFVVKDPRICRLVPFWLSVLEEFGADPVFAISIRNPLEVAASLKARNGFLPAKSLLLWLGHFLESEFHTRGYRRCFTSYDALLQDWYKVLLKISEYCEIKWPRLSHGTTVEIEDFLSIGLKHNCATYEEINSRPDIVSWVKQAYDWALNATEGRFDPPEALDDIRNALEAADNAFGPLFAAKQLELKKSRDEVGQLNKKIETIQGESDNVAEQLAAEKKQNTDYNKRIDDLTSQNTTRQKENENLEAQLNELKIQLKKVTEYEATIDRLKSERDQLKKKFQDAQDQVGQLQENKKLAETLQFEKDLVVQKLLESQAEVEQIRLESNEAVQKTQQLQSRLETTIAERDMAKDQLEQLQANSKNVEDLTDERNNLLDLLEQANIKQEMVVKERDEIQNMVKRLNDTIGKISQQSRMADDELNSSKSEIDTLSKNINMRFGEIAKLTEMLQEANHRNHALESELQRLVDGIRELRPVLAQEIGKIVVGLQNQDGNSLSKMLMKGRHLRMLKKTGIVNAEWYLEENQDVAEENIDPFFHYLRFGSHEGREPNSFLQNAFSKMLERYEN